MIVYKGRLLKKSSNWKSKLILSKLVTTHSTVSFASDLVANFGCYRLRIMTDIISKLLRAAIWSRCAVLFESEQTLFSRTGPMLRSSINFCCFAQDSIQNIRLCSYVIFLLTDQWLIERSVTDRKISRIGDQLGRKLQILQKKYLLKTWKFNPILKRTCSMASFRRFRVLAIAM